MTVSAERGDDNARTDWKDLKREATDAARDTAEDAREAGSAFIDSARDRASDYLERRKDSAVQSIDDVAHTLRDSGENFEDRPNIRLFVDSAADGLEHLAEEIRDRSFVEIYADVEEFARRRPTLFAGAAGVAGFMLARFLKSSAEDAYERRAYGDEMRRRRGDRRASGYAPGADEAGFAPRRETQYESAHKPGAGTSPGGHAAERTPPGETAGAKPSTAGASTVGASTGKTSPGESTTVSGVRDPGRSGGAPGTSNAASAQAAANAAARPQGER